MILMRGIRIRVLSFYYTPLDFFFFFAADIKYNYYDNNL